jgi:16S rRNA (cytosine967-C5)-methyltransferase
MGVSAARAAAFEILLRVEREDSYATELLHSAAVKNLSTRDHALTTELVMGVLRWRSSLDRQISRTSSQKLNRLDDEVLAALRLGVYQLRFLSRVPARATIYESVELVKLAGKRSAASLVNAVLRKIEQDRACNYLADIAVAADAETLAESAAHPLWLVERWIAQYGFENACQICIYDQTIPKTSIHIFDQRAVEELAAHGVRTTTGKLLTSALRVISGDVAATSAFGEGRLSIQDEASQLVAMIAARDGKHAGTVLDCCAAPGSKTRFIARQDPSATVVAGEIHTHRARLLRGLVRLPNVRVVVADARRLPFSRFFGRILADVPCSGTGTLARNPEIKWRLEPDDFSDLQARQMAILESALAQLGTGGRLVYSTCSLETEENEAVIEAVLAKSSNFKLVNMKTELQRLCGSADLAPGLAVESLLAGPYLRTIPGVHECDGFFAAKIQRI